MSSIKRILVAYDDSPLAEKALRLAIDVAHDIDGALVDVAYVSARPSSAFVNVDDAAAMVRVLASQGEMALARAEKIVEPAGVPYKLTLLDGASAAPKLLGYAKESGADLIVIGSSGKRGFTEQFGSVSHAVLHGAHVPVLVTRQ